MKLQPSLQINIDEVFPHLSNAPIVEAVIQWVARPSKMLAPDELRHELAKQLPGYPDCQPQRALLLETQFDVDGSSRHSQKDTWLGFRCMSDDKLHIFQFNRDGVLFSRLKPYANWEAFLFEAMRVWRVFVGIAEPAEIERLGVRFINRIAPVDVSDLGTYLKRPPSTFSNLGLPISNFLWQSRHDVPGQPFQINVIQAIQPPAGLQSNEPGLILDIDVSSTQPVAPTDELVADYLAKMRWLKDKAFFSLLKKSAVKLFQGETQ